MRRITAGYKNSSNAIWRIVLRSESVLQVNFTRFIYHRQCGVLTATHHSYGSPRLSDFVPCQLNRFSRKMAQTTWIHARMCLLQY